VDGSGARPIAQAAGSSEVLAIATHPMTQVFASVTEDKMLRVWDTQSASLIHSTLLPHKSKCLNFSPDGSLLALGLAGNNLVVYNASDLQLVFSTMVMTQPEIHSTSAGGRASGGGGEYVCLAFSPDQTLLAASSTDRVMEIFDVSDGFHCVGRTKGLMTTITQLDWSEDSKVIQTDDTHHQHLFFEWDGTFVQRPIACRSMQWSTWTCRLGWHVQGVWPNNSDPGYITSVVRSHSHSLCCSADVAGEVKVFPFPIPMPKAIFKSFHGHACALTGAQFTAKDEYLVSAGGTSIFVWKVVQ
jgi:WD40 repeat protein